MATGVGAPAGFGVVAGLEAVTGLGDVAGLGAAVGFGAIATGAGAVTTGALATGAFMALVVPGCRVCEAGTEVSRERFSEKLWPLLNDVLS